MMGKVEFEGGMPAWGARERVLHRRRSFLLHLTVLLGSILVLMLPAVSQAEDAPAPAAQSKSTEAPAPAAALQTLAQQFDDWTWRCVAPSSEQPSMEKATCEVAQTVKVNQDGKAVDILNLAVSAANDKAGKVQWALVALTPLDVDLPSDFGLAVGGDKAKPLLTRYRNCNHNGCFVVAPLDTAAIGRFRRAQDGAGFFRLTNGKTVKVVFSLKGFDKAFDKLASKALPPVLTPAITPLPVQEPQSK